MTLCFTAGVIGAKSRNLDGFFAEPELLRALLCRNSEGCDISVLEGVMGYYDGAASTSLASSYAVVRSAPELGGRLPPVNRLSEPVAIAVAQDEAFCFYYEDNLQLLRDMGADIVPFSPISDSALPPCNGLLLGAGIRN